MTDNEATRDEAARALIDLPTYTNELGWLVVCHDDASLATLGAPNKRHRDSRLVPTGRRA